MKKEYIIILTLIPIIFSCQKEQQEEIRTFNISTENAYGTQSKITHDGTHIYWQTKDTVMVYGDMGGASYLVTPRSDDSSYGIMHWLSGNMGFAPYKAYYPASIGKSASSIVLPTNQYSPDGSLSRFPMYAESSSSEMIFKNLCGLLKIHLQHNNARVYRISITANSYICGVFNVSVSNGIPSLNYNTAGSHTVNLYLNTAQDISDGKDFYVYLPAGIYSTITMKVYNDQNYYCTKAGSNVVVERSKYSTVTVNQMDFNSVSPDIFYYQGIEYEIPRAIDLGLPSGTLWTANQVGFRYLRYIDEATGDLVQEHDLGLNSSANDISLPNGWELPSPTDWQELLSQTTISEFDMVIDYATGVYYFQLGFHQLTSANNNSIRLWIEHEGGSSDGYGHDRYYGVFLTNNPSNAMIVDRGYHWSYIDGYTYFNTFGIIDTTDNYRGRVFLVKHP